MTGGGGFIGSNLALELEREGWEVVVMDRDPLGLAENLPGFSGQKQLVDVALELPWSGPLDAVFHQAAITDPRYPNEKELWKNNLESYALVRDLVRRTGAKFIYASSAGVYGHSEEPMKEGQAEDPITAYGSSKLEIDRLVARELPDHFCVGLRYFNVYGPHESGKGRPASMIWHLAKQIRSGETPKLFKYGEQKRDFVYVKDIVRANLLALKSSSGVFNVGTGVATSFNQLVELLNEILGQRRNPEYFDMPYEPHTYQHFTKADLTLAAQKLKYQPQWDLKTGVLDYFSGLNFVLR